MFASVCMCARTCACMRVRVRVRLFHTKVQMEIKISELESKLLSAETTLLEEKALTETLQQELHRVLKEHDVVRSLSLSLSLSMNIRTNIHTFTAC